MKIVEQSFEILEDEQDLVKQIGNRARICYKSEGKAKDDESSFVRGIIKNGHNSCLEMGVVTLLIENYPYTKLPDVHSLFESKYLIADRLTGDAILVTGSIRAWREWIKTNVSHKGIVHNIGTELKNKYPLFFEDIQGISNYYPGITVREFNPNSNFFYLPKSIKKRHIHKAVKFITNRAISHELCRHRPASYLQESQRYCRYSNDQFGNQVAFISPMFFDVNNPEQRNAYNIWKQSCEESEQTYFALLHGGYTPQAARTVLPNSCKTELIVYAPLREWEHIFAMRAINEAAEPSMREIMVPTHEAFKCLFPFYFDAPQVSVG